MSKPKRIYQIAIELNISHSDIIDFLEGIGESGYGHMSEVSSGVYSKIISKYSKDKKRLTGKETLDSRTDCQILESQKHEEE